MFVEDDFINQMLTTNFIGLKGLKYLFKVKKVTKKMFTKICLADSVTYSAKL